MKRIEGKERERDLRRVEGKSCGVGRGKGKRGRGKMIGDREGAAGGKRRSSERERGVRGENGEMK